MKQEPQTPKKKYNLRKRKNNKKKIINNSDSESDSDSDYIPDVSDDEEEEEEFAVRQWQRFMEKCSLHNILKNVIKNYEIWIH